MSSNGDIVTAQRNAQKANMRSEQLRREMERILQELKKTEGGEMAQDLKPLDKILDQLCDECDLVAETDRKAFKGSIQVTASDAVAYNDAGRIVSNSQASLFAASMTDCREVLATHPEAFNPQAQEAETRCLFRSIKLTLGDTTLSAVSNTVPLSSIRIPIGDGKVIQAGSEEHLAQYAREMVKNLIAAGKKKKSEEQELTDKLFTRFKNSMLKEKDVNVPLYLSATLTVVDPEMPDWCKAWKSYSYNQKILMTIIANNQSLLAIRSPEREAKYLGFGRWEETDGKMQQMMCPVEVTQTARAYTTEGLTLQSPEANFDDTPMPDSGLSGDGLRQMPFIFPPGSQPKFGGPTVVALSIPTAQEKGSEQAKGLAGAAPVATRGASGNPKRQAVATFQAPNCRQCDVEVGAPLYPMPPVVTNPDTLKLLLGLPVATLEQQVAITGADWTEDQLRAVAIKALTQLLEGYCLILHDLKLLGSTGPQAVEINADAQFDKKNADHVQGFVSTATDLATVTGQSVEQSLSAFGVEINWDADIHPKKLEELENSDLRCPISMDIMQTPVKDIYEHTYDEEYIKAWIKKNGKSPLTRQPLTLQDLTHDHETEHKILMFMAANGSLDVKEPQPLIPNNDNALSYTLKSLDKDWDLVQSRPDNAAAIFEPVLQLQVKEHDGRDDEEGERNVTCAQTIHTHVTGSYQYVCCTYLVKPDLLIKTHVRNLGEKFSFQPVYVSDTGVEDPDEVMTPEKDESRELPYPVQKDKDEHPDGWYLKDDQGRILVHLNFTVIPQ